MTCWGTVISSFQLYYYLSTWSNHWDVELHLEHYCFSVLRMSDLQFEFYETWDIAITSKPQFVSMDQFLLLPNFCIHLSSTVFISDVKYNDLHVKEYFYRLYHSWSDFVVYHTRPCWILISYWSEGLDKCTVTAALTLLLTVIQIPCILMIINK